MMEVRIQHRWPGFELDIEFQSEAPVLGLFGASGAGKSTLLHALSGWQRPAQGFVRVGGVVLQDDASGLFVPIEKRGFAVVPQDPLLFPHRSVRANLEFAPRAQSKLKSAEGQRMLEWLQIGHLLERRTQTLSGGERQRIALGRAWLSEPKRVLLDEPAASLDPELASEVMALLQQAKAESQVPMVFVTHRSTELLALADECLLLNQGRLQAQGPPREVLAQTQPEPGLQSQGVENLLRLRVQEHRPSEGITYLDLGAGQALAVPLTATPPGQSVAIALRGEDILLAKAHPGPTSARNALEARLLRLTPIGAEVLVDLQVGEQTMAARITPGAVQGLALAAGQPVHLLIKTTACVRLHTVLP